MLAPRKLQLTHIYYTTRHTTRVNMSFGKPCRWRAAKLTYFDFTYITICKYRISITIRVLLVGKAVVKTKCGMYISWSYRHWLERYKYPSYFYHLYTKQSRQRLGPTDKRLLLSQWRRRHANDQRVQYVFCLTRWTALCLRSPFLALPATVVMSPDHALPFPVSPQPAWSGQLSTSSG